jgi:hypothetical protein
MDPITREKLAGNAYRTLGLGGSSSQSVIASAARRMRIWPDASRVPPTPWDLPELGPIRRSKPNIEQAVALLNQPASRLEHRLLWFAGDRIPDATADGHAGAIASLQTAWMGENSTGELWTAVIRRIIESSESPELVGWMRETEQTGQFDKRASPEEIENAVAHLPAAVAAGVVGKAILALEQGNLETVTAIAMAVRQVKAPPRQIHPADDLLDRLEDVFNTRSAEMEKDLRDNLRINRQSPDGFYAANYVHATRGGEIYDEKILPVMSALLQLSAGDNDRLTRLKSRCGELLVLLALGWEWSGRFVAAEQQLQQAMLIAAGTVAELEVRRELDRVSPLAAAERKQAWASANVPVISYQTGVGVGYENVNPAINLSIKPKKPVRKKKRSAAGFGWVFAVLGSILAHAFFTSSPTPVSTPNLDQPALQNFTLPNPRLFLPPPRNDPFPNPDQDTPRSAEDPRTSVGDDFREPT